MSFLVLCFGFAFGMAFKQNKGQAHHAGSNLTQRDGASLIMLRNGIDALLLGHS